MNPYITGSVIPQALALLPPTMDSPEARAMLIAIALQESRMKHRAQIAGPARGFWQFEAGGGVRGVLMHQQTRPHVLKVLEALSYDDSVSVSTSYIAIEHNDVLACVFARLLLWTLPGPLPKQGDPNEGWRQYIEAWRPGKPHRGTWDGFFLDAWSKEV